MEILALRKIFKAPVGQTRHTNRNSQKHIFFDSEGRRVYSSAQPFLKYYGSNTVFLHLGRVHSCHGLKKRTQVQARVAIPAIHVSYSVQILPLLLISRTKVQVSTIKMHAWLDAVASFQKLTTTVSIYNCNQW